MQSLTFIEPGRVEWLEIPTPRLDGPTEALVRPIAVATCDLDAAVIAGRIPLPGPFTLGHEFVAKVTEIGDAVGSVQPDDVVIVSFQVSCGTCPGCRRRRTANCTTVWAPGERLAMFGAGVADWGGAITDLVRIPYADAMLTPVPDDITPSTVASAADNVADGWRAVAPYLAQTPEAPVLILAGDGPNSIALYTAQWAIGLGSSRVRVATTNETTAQFASGIGAEIATLDAWPDRLDGSSIVIDSSNDPAGLACAIRSTDPGGTCTSTSLYFDVEVPFRWMYTSGISLNVGAVQSAACLPDVLAAVQAGVIDPDLIVSDRCTWAEAADAISSYETKLIISRHETPEASPTDVHGITLRPDG